MENPVFDYYQQLSGAYDQDRFGNSYGRYLHRQEHRFLSQTLSQYPPAQVLDLACGTGRLLEFADTGLDASPNMLEQARLKWPGKTLVTADAQALPFAADSFAAAYSFHLLMHLSAEQSAQVLTELHRVLRPGGLLVCDFPSATRRRLRGGHHRNGWHGSNAFTLPGFLALAGPSWRLVQYQGALFFPIHRLPASWRRPLGSLDDWFCRSWAKPYASYLLVCLQKI